MPRKISWARIKDRLASLVLLGMVCLACIVVLPTSSVAAEVGMPMETVAPLEAGSEIAAEKVDQFAQAYLKVLELLNDREAELPAAETSAEALKVQQSIESEAMALITDSGLTLPDYMEMLGLASQDEAFRDKVLGRMDESLQEESGQRQ